MGNKGPVLFALVLVPLAAIGIHYWLFANVATPPPDFGSGDMFDKIAPNYDLVNRVLAINMDVGWRKVMVEKVKQRTFGNPKILDLATGTADVALLLAEGIPGSTVIGVDPSNKMLDVGRVKVKDRELDTRIELREGDAQDLMSSLKENSFDAATMSFGIRNVPDREKALCQIHHVLRPNSVLSILEFSEPEDDAGIMGYLARMFIRHVVPVVGGIVSGAPREYLHLQNSIKDFPSPKEFVTLMESVECGEDGQGTFRLDELIQMNFGSVQLYVATPITRASVQ